MALYLLIGGVMLSALALTSLGCHLPWSQDLENKEIFMLLIKLKTIPSYSYVNDRTHFKYPWKRGQITEIQKTHAMFPPSDVPADLPRLQYRERLCCLGSSLLDELLSRIDYSLEQLEKMKVENLLSYSSLGIFVGKYFQGIIVYMKEKKYSSCAWEVVRGEIEMYFSRI
ncbi:LOW QUALITY PROTEIN: interferon alpha-8-like [Choloepus didactylus]|uniref:LOW QUALITY PROTEIN: interferon alpha-8-like n=1 Tax=Choloepus didactylus TaxID=27675 RepID=UPI00189EFBC9|nr:LOW QUALITY PROTEIN: interferon alpha-8-like [Choloepus didactylus]